MRALSAFLMRGRTQTVLVIGGFGAFSLLLPPVSLISTAALALTALRLNWQESAVRVALAVLVVAAVASVLGINAPAAMLYVSVVWLPAWGASLLLRESGHLELSLQFLGLLGALAVGLQFLLIDSPAEFWRSSLSGLVEEIVNRSQGEADREALTTNVGSMAPYMSGMSAAISVLMLGLALLIGRWQQAVLFNPGGFGSEFRALRLARSYATVVVALIALGAVPSALGEWSVNTAIPLLIPMLFLGFAVVHATLAADGKFWLTGFYVILVLVPGAIVSVVLIGLSDAWADWRKRLKRFKD